MLANITTYNELLKERAKILLVYNESNPIVQQQDKNLQELRQQLIFGLNCLNKEFSAKTFSLNKSASSVKSALLEIPDVEKGFTQLTRKQSIIQEMYLYLLKAKAEIAMTKEKEISSIKIISSPTVSSFGDGGNPQRTLFIHVLIALLVPSVFVYCRHLVNGKISSFDDLASRTTVPLIGVVNHISGKVSRQKTEKYTIGEQFRFLRSNILQIPQNKCILITSTIAGEGKSFVSINVAKSLAILGKKVVLLELDLRKPSIAKTMGVEGQCGITEYGRNSILDFLSLGYDTHGSSGDVPPNAFFREGAYAVCS